MAERAFPAPTVAQIGGSRIIATPFQFATTDDDNLQIVCANSLAGVVLTISGRRLTAAGAIEPFSYLCVPPSDRTLEAKNFKLGGGALLNLVIFASTGAPVIGQTFVSARMIRGLSGATILLGGLLGGYVTASQPLVYPGSPIQSSIEGGGYPRTVTGTDPAAGSVIAETVPTGARWQLLAIGATLTTSAVVATRRARLNLSPAGVAVVESPTGFTMAASDTRTHYWGQGLPIETAIANNLSIAGVPLDVPLVAGSVIVITHQNFDPGDNWGAPTFQVREWLEVNA